MAYCLHLNDSEIVFFFFLFFPFLTLILSYQKNHMSVSNGSEREEKRNEVK